jgi:hypothetical protein
MKILYFFLFLWVIFALLDLDPDPATQINADLDPDTEPDPQPCRKRNNRERIVLVKNEHRRIKARILRTGCNGYEEGEGWADGCICEARAERIRGVWVG